MRKIAASLLILALFVLSLPLAAKQKASSSNVTWNYSEWDNKVKPKYGAAIWIPDKKVIAVILTEKPYRPTSETQLPDGPHVILKIEFKAAKVTKSGVVDATLIPGNLGGNSDLGHLGTNITQLRFGRFKNWKEKETYDRVGKLTVHTENGGEGLKVKEAPVYIRRR